MRVRRQRRPVGTHYEELGGTNLEERLEDELGDGFRLVEIDGGALCGAGCSATSARDSYRGAG